MDFDVKSLLKEGAELTDRALESVEDEVLGPLDADERRILRDLLARAMDAHRPTPRSTATAADD